ncbi:MAG TPA: leucyl/phenylalanyl-tRNA--protein transferase [Bacteroidales bacterium]|nr:leucyl/phenylalanyl-tRNA--protein transferase [Bacteroidales bacterium]HPE58223.1 leucyl/phenylalanyl-tRNA--protein transferase [Bacteroidales bacterium]
MPVFKLTEEIVFPDPELADESGLLAVGGDLTHERLILAYANGIFPWYSKGEPILWWSPNPRMILLPQNIKISKSLDQTIRLNKYTTTFDNAFEEVIKSCKTAPRPGQTGTWITAEMQEAYIALHKLGFAHSVETWQNEELVGGLYGVSLGKAFFGESMFFKSRDASKVALVNLASFLQKHNFKFIDSQVETDHLKSMGAISISRPEFLELLKEAILLPTKRGKW